MDERTKILICLSAATTANCVPCFTHYFEKAKAMQLAPEDIQEAVDLAGKVKHGAHMVLINHVRDTMGATRLPDDPPCRTRSGSSCCG
jgi:alkylhydroperoxidase/carboxymuconolactone decarboxylase family protein YurZ